MNDRNCKIKQCQVKITDAAEFCRLCHPIAKSMRHFKEIEGKKFYNCGCDETDEIIDLICVKHKEMFDLKLKK